MHILQSLYFSTSHPISTTEITIDSVTQKTDFSYLIKPNKQRLMLCKTPYKLITHCTIMSVFAKSIKSAFIQIIVRQRAKEFNLMITIHKLLLAEANEIPGGKVVSTFQGPSCTETPA
ncbi:hypothetical protein ACB094_05G009000 [Castanea mollissima]